MDWRKLKFHNERLQKGIAQFLAAGHGYIEHPTGFIVPNDRQALPYMGNWIFFGHTSMLRDCYLWHHVMFNHFELVPEFCRLRCYKVVVKVRNFLEAMDFYGLMNANAFLNAEISAIPGKVGMDERFYSDGHFNGFVYCDGLEEALEKYRVVRDLVNEHIPTGPDIPIIVKRTCTEFERRFGATDQPFWQSMPKDELDFQHHLEDIFKGQWTCAVQPDWLRNHLVLKFAKWANTVGDKSWIEYFGEDFLTMKAVTYHQSQSVEAKGESENDSG